MLDIGAQEGAMGSGDAVGRHVHRPSSRKGSTVGVPTTNIGGLHTGNLI